MRALLRQRIEGKSFDLRTAREGSQDPDELRQWSRNLGQGQRLDFFEVLTDCASCGAQEVPTNVVGICGTCARRLSSGGLIGQRAEPGPKQRRKSVTIEKVDAPHRLNLLFPWTGSKNAPWALLLILAGLVGGCSTSPDVALDCTTDSECSEAYGIDY